jgi:hypothetical protein
VTYASTCASSVTGGNFEAKRVWTQVPSEAQGSGDFTNKGVKLTWTGCGTATAQFASK